MTVLAKAEDGWVQNERYQLYYRVPNLLVKYVCGSPYGIVTLGLTIVKDSESLMITIVEKDCDSSLMVCTIEYTNLFKSIISPVSSLDHYEDDVMGMINRHEAIGYAITKYVKKNLQVGDLDHAAPL